MPINWNTYPGFRPAGCLPCCSGAPTPPGECACALLIPPFASPYADYATAAAVIADPLQVASCIAYSNDPFADSLTASFDGASYDVSATFPSATTSFGDVWVSIAAKAGATLTLAFTDAANGAMRIYSCDGTEIELLGPSASPLVSAALPADGEYFIAIALSSPPMTTDFSACSFALTSSDTIWVNPVIAQWDDSGTTRKLWACPKLSVPLGTESSGDWFASCSDAASYMAASVIDCFVVEELVDSVSDGGSASGGSSLVVSDTVHNNPPYNSIPPHFALHASINLEAGESVDIAYNVTGDGNWPADDYSFGATIFSQDGDPLPSTPSAGDTGPGATPISGTKTFATFSGFPPTPTTWLAPYSGRYEIVIDVIGPRKDDGVDFVASSLTGSFTVTSSGTMSVNPIQARYDLGLDCPALLNCGDSCP